MSIRFKVYNTPSPNKEEKPAQHARSITYGTRRIEDICRYISDCSTLTSADIRGVLEALTLYIGNELADGYNVELEGFGNFSAALKSTQTVTEKGKAAVLVSVDGVNFRCAKRLKQIVQADRPQKAKSVKTPSLNPNDRKTRMLNYLGTNNYITLSDYAKINNCSHYRATLEIKQFLADGLLRHMGYKTHRVYLLAEESEPNRPRPQPDRQTQPDASDAVE